MLKNSNASMSPPFDVPFCSVYFGKYDSNTAKANHDKATLVLQDSAFKAYDDSTLSKLFANCIEKISVTENLDGVITGEMTMTDSNEVLHSLCYEGRSIVIEMGYFTKDFISQAAKKVVLVGVTGKPKIDFNADGRITMTVPLKARIDSMRFLVPQTVTYGGAKKPMTRQELVYAVLSKHVQEGFLDSIYIDMGDDGKLNVEEKQVRENDYSFLQRLARQWGCVLSTRFFGDTTQACFLSKGHAAIERLAKFDLSEGLENGMLYPMEWRVGLKNLVSFTVGGDTARAGGQDYLVKNPKTNQFEKKSEKDIQDMAKDKSQANTQVWKLSEEKVKKYLEAHPEISAAQLYTIAFNNSVKNNRELFFEQEPIANINVQKQNDPILGKVGGEKADFIMAWGDPNLTINQLVYVGGVYYPYATVTGDQLKQLVKSKPFEEVHTPAYKAGTTKVTIPYHTYRPKTVVMNQNVAQYQIDYVVKNLGYTFVGTNSQGQEFLAPNIVAAKDSIKYNDISEFNVWKTSVVTHSFSTAGLNTNGSLIR